MRTTEQASTPAPTKVSGSDALVFRDIAVGYEASCGITADQTVACWGEGRVLGQDPDLDLEGSAEPLLVSGVTGLTSIALGDTHACAVAQGGKVFCWGDNDRLQLGSDVGDFSGLPVEVPFGAGEVAVDVSAGGDSTCAVLASGGVKCWGAGDNLQLGVELPAAQIASSPIDVPLPSSFVATSVANAFYHTCALDAASGAAYCWGDNADGVMSLGEDEDGEYPPRQLTGEAFWQTNSLGLGVVIALAAPAPFWCGGCFCVAPRAPGRSRQAHIVDKCDQCCAIGTLASGRLLAGTAGRMRSKSHVERRLNSFTAVALCLSLGAVVAGCGDSGDDGDTENPPVTPPPAADAGLVPPVGGTGGGVVPPTPIPDAGVQPVVPVTPVTPVVPVDDAGVMPPVAGSGGAPMPPVAGAGGAPMPPAPPAGPFSSLSVGDELVCVVSAGKVLCTGIVDAVVGEDPTYTLQPLAGAANANIVSIGTGYDHACVVNAAGELYCIGENLDGQLGNGDTEFASVTALTAAVVPEGVQFVSVDSAEVYNCALSSAGEAYCWGLNDEGQVGNAVGVGEDGEVVPVPTKVPGPPGVTYTALKIGYEHACATGQDRKLYCWGRGDQGNLGRGTDDEDSSPVPAPVVGLDGVVDFALGDGHTCAVVDSGRVMCWGEAPDLQLGTAQPDDVSAPIEVPLPAGAVATAIAGHQNTTCVALETGAVWCWGQGQNGQLGRVLPEGVTTALPAPVDMIPGGFVTTDLAIGLDHACAYAASTGTAVCWGINGIGIIGNGTDDNVFYPPTPLVLPVSSVPAGVDHDRRAVVAVSVCAIA